MRGMPYGRHSTAGGGQRLAALGGLRPRRRGARPRRLVMPASAGSGRRRRRRKLRIGATAAAIGRPRAGEIGGAAARLRGHARAAHAPDAVLRAAAAASVQRARAVRPSAAPAGPPLPSTRPSASVIRTSRPAGSPLRSGLRTAVILSLRLHVAELPAALHQDARAAELDGPVLRRLGAVGHVDLDIGVRIGPLELRDRARERHAASPCRTSRTNDARSAAPHPRPSAPRSPAHLPAASTWTSSRSMAARRYHVGRAMGAIRHPASERRTSVAGVGRRTSRERQPKRRRRRPPSPVPTRAGR